jgi:hypothetical protein
MAKGKHSAAEIIGGSPSFPSRCRFEADSAFLSPERSPRTGSFLLTEN